MRITESELRSVISKIINEMSDMLPPIDMSGGGVADDVTSFMGKALACCKMDHVKLFEMCAKIYGGNPSQVSHCAELIACVSRGDEQGCCRCLAEICKCGHCAQVCDEYCGC